MTNKKLTDALDQIAANRFEVYASDIHAMIQRGYYKGAELKKQKIRAETWLEAAEEMRSIIKQLEKKNG